MISKITYKGNTDTSVVIQCLKTTSLWRCFPQIIQKSFVKRILGYIIVKRRLCKGIFFWHTADLTWKTRRESRLCTDLFVICMSFYLYSCRVRAYLKILETTIDFGEIFLLLFPVQIRQLMLLNAVFLFFSRLMGTKRHSMISQKSVERSCKFIDRP